MKLRYVVSTIVAGLVMLGTALQAGEAKLAWDYPFQLEPTVDAFKLYSLRGSNSVFTVYNDNANYTNLVLKTDAWIGSGIGTNGWTTNLSTTVSNLTPGWWTFTVTATVLADGIESVNATNASGRIRPLAVWNIQVH